MKPDQRVMLDRRIAEERFDPLPIVGTAPHWVGHFDIMQPKVWTMDLDGAVSPSWRYLDEVSWTNVAAVRVENAGGIVLDTTAWNDDDFDEDDFA